ncbi:MAG: ABC transporter permease [Nanoarchaeota archaeon]
MIQTTLIKTNLRRLLATKATTLVILLGPLLIFILAGFAYESSQLTNIPIATYAAKPSQFTNSFISGLKSRNIHTNSYNDEQLCIDAVRKGTARACLSFGWEEPPNITFHVDYTNLYVVGEISNIFSDTNADYTTRLGINYTRQLLERLKAAKEEIEKSRPIIVTFATQQEQINRELDTITGNLGALSVELDEALPTKVSNQLNSSNVVFLFENINGLKNRIDAQFRAAAENVSKQLDASAISETDKQRIKQILEDAKERLRTTGDEFRITSELSQQDISNFKSLTDSLVKNIRKAHDELEKLDSLKFESRKAIKDLQKEMNNNLLSLILMQNTFNKISALASDTNLQNAAVGYSPLQVSIKSLLSPHEPKLKSVYPQLLVLMLLLSGTLLSSILIILERESPAQVRNQLMPVSIYEYTMANFFTIAILLFIQTSIIILLAGMFVGISSVLSIFYAILTVVIITAFATALGTAIGSLIRTEQGAIICATILILGMLMISDTFLPIETLPTGLVIATDYNPYYIAAGTMKRILLFDVDITTQIVPITILILYTLVCAGIAIASRRRWKTI